MDDDLLFDIIAESVGHTSRIDTDKFIRLLEEEGFIIVPIEDPTNLRYGVEDWPMSRKAHLAQLNMTQEKLLSSVEQLLTSQGQFKQLLPSPLSEQLSTLGKGGDTSPTALIDTLMQWYGTLSPKQQVKVWTAIVDFCMLLTPHGTPSRD
jgi:hypothetical protein